jgi:hypothetical protein
MILIKHISYQNTSERITYGEDNSILDKTAAIDVKTPSKPTQ